MGKVSNMHGKHPLGSRRPAHPMGETPMPNPMAQTERPQAPQGGMSPVPPAPVPPESYGANEV